LYLNTWDNLERHYISDVLEQLVAPTLVGKGRAANCCKYIAAMVLKNEGATTSLLCDMADFRHVSK
jgi:hypothetical protein